MKLQCIHNIKCTLSCVHKSTTASSSSFVKAMSTWPIWFEKEWRSQLQSKVPMVLLGRSLFQLLSKLGQMEKEHSGGVRLNSFSFTCSLAWQFRGGEFEGRILQ